MVNPNLFYLVKSHSNKFHKRSSSKATSLSLSNKEPHPKKDNNPYLVLQQTPHVQVPQHIRSKIKLPQLQGPGIDKLPS